MCSCRLYNVFCLPIVSQDLLCSGDRAAKYIAGTPPAWGMGMLKKYEKHRPRWDGAASSTLFRKANADLCVGRPNDPFIILWDRSSVKFIFQPNRSTSLGVRMSGNLAQATTFDAFARYYDADYRDYSDDLDLILTLAAETGDPVLELGCGTGRLLAPLAAQGHDVTGIDVSTALLAIARQKLALADTLSHVQLVHADMRSYDLPRKDYGLAFCTSNTFMHLTRPQEQLQVLHNTYRHLRQGAALLIDLFNPDVVRLAQIDGMQEYADRWVDDVTGAQVIKWVVRTVDWAQQLQDTIFIYEEVQPNGTSVRTTCPFTLRFVWRSEAELMLQKAGFVLEHVWGDFEGNEYDAASDHLILLARKE
jgi:SAM-dependent methyltransferase